MHLCHYGGYVVDSASWLPTEPTDFFRASYGIGSVGCNHLVCSACGELVRHTLEGTSRRYQCACESYVARGATYLDNTSEIDPDPLPPWRCAGHPSFVPPGEIAGVEVGSTLGWSPIVGDHIVDASNLHPSIDRIPGFTLTRIFQALEGEVDQEALALAVGNRGADSSLRVRQAVALFMALNSNASALEPGFGRVLDAWRARPELYDDHLSAIGTGRRLKTVLLEAIAVRVRLGTPGAPEALATWRWAALRGSGLGDHLHRAALIDAEWTKEHVEQLLDLAPADWEAILISIHVEFPMRLAPGLRRAIAEGHTTRERVAAVLSEEYGAKAEPVLAALA